MESVRNWLEQTIGMPIDYICIIIMGMLTLHVLIRIAIHGNMEFLKKYGKSGNDTEKKSMIPLKKVRGEKRCVSKFGRSENI